MHVKLFVPIIIFYICILLSINVKANEDNPSETLPSYSAAYFENKFKSAMFLSCDQVLEKLENGSCTDNICRGMYVPVWAACWRKSMNSVLDKRLLKLKDSDITEFHFEMRLQKTFNEATENLCRKQGGDQRYPSDMMDYNFCLVDAYKYRTAQAIQINNNQFSVPTKGNLLPSISRVKYKKGTRFFKTFSEQICKMPTTVWDRGSRSLACQKKVFMELDSFDFTDNAD